MAKSAVLEVKEGKVREALGDLWRQLLERGLVDALLVPQVLPSGDNVVQTLVRDADALSTPDALAPVMPVNSARLVSQMTKVTPSPLKVGAVLRPCELRALVELVKLKQASLENVVVIGTDCLGTYTIAEYRRRAADSPGLSDEFIRSATQGTQDPQVREACQMCEYPAPTGADLVIGVIGTDPAKGVLVQALTPQGEALFDGLGLAEGGDADAQRREQAIAELVSQRQRRRDEVFAATEREAKGLEQLLAVLSPCIKCHNCRTVCPICYCKECFFDSPTFEMEAEKYLGWAERRGAIRMPTDTLLFHLTRMNHMAISCVGCGMCSEACPNDIPVANLFRWVAAGVQDVFHYVPGRSVEEELPLATFKEDELQEVGRR